ncbi:MAG: permease, partial [Anaerolineaceae bacterium]
MDAILNLLLVTIEQVWVTFTHNWIFLVVSVLVAVALKLYLDSDKISAFLLRHKRAGVIGATVAAVTTPLCSCGTTAIILGMMASMMPWAPIVAFMVSSPLTSPQELIYSAGLFGWRFAVVFYVASIVLGLMGGGVASWMESRGWLANQSRYINGSGFKKPQPVEPVCACEKPQPIEVMLKLPVKVSDYVAATATSSPTCCGEAVIPKMNSCACDAASDHVEPASSRVTLRMFLTETWATGKRLLLMFFGFAFIGYFLNGLIPAAWVAAIFGAGNVYSVPLAATLGLPLYLNTEASLPLVRALIDGGMSQGAALAFLITGAGTSIGAIT